SISSLFFGTTAGRFFTRYLLLSFGGALMLIKGVSFLWEQYTKEKETPLKWRPWPQDTLDYMFIPIGVFFLCLMNVQPFPGFLVHCLVRIGRWLHYLFWELPAHFWQLPWVQRFFHSWPFLLLYWYILQPLACYAVLLYFWTDQFATPTMAAITVLVANLVLNS